MFTFNGEPALTPNFRDPWLADSEWLLAELAKARERIPFRLENHSDVVAASGRIFQLEQRLRFLLQIQREGQRDFAKQHEEQPGQSKQHSARKKKSNIIRLRA